MNSPLVIYDANIPGLVSPIIYPVAPPLVGGVPLSLIINQLLELWIDPWVNMSSGDYVGVLVNGSTTPAVGKPINPGEENKRFTLSLNEAFLVNGPNEVKLQVTRIGPTAPETSAGLRFLFNKPRPGGEFPGAGPNTNLRMTLPPDVIANGVDAIRASQGVDVTLSYLFMRAQDVISLDLDSQIKTHTVTQAEATAGSVVIRLLTADFWQDNARFALQFRATDQLGNSSGPQAIWSPATTIDVHVKQPALILTKPKLLEAMLSGGTVMDFDAHFYSAPHATVEVKYTGSDPGQTVYVECIGRAETFNTQPQSGPAAGQALTVSIPRRVIIDSIAHKIQFRYYVKLPNTAQYLPSNDLDVNILQQRHICGVPTINGSKNNLRLYAPNPLEAQYTARISLTIDGQTRLDSIELPYPYPSAPYMDFAIPPSWISSNPGKTAYFNYTIRLGMNPIIFSPYLKVFL